MLDKTLSKLLTGLHESKLFVQSVFICTFFSKLTIPSIYMSSLLSPVKNINIYVQENMWNKTQNVSPWSFIHLSAYVWFCTSCPQSGVNVNLVWCAGEGWCGWGLWPQEYFLYAQMSIHCDEYVFTVIYLLLVARNLYKYILLLSFLALRHIALLVASLVVAKNWSLPSAWSNTVVYICGGYWKWRDFVLK